MQLNRMTSHDHSASALAERFSFLSSNLSDDGRLTNDDGSDNDITTVGDRRDASESNCAVFQELGFLAAPPAAKPTTKKPHVCHLPSKEDPMDDSFSETLFTRLDKVKLSPAHILIRRDILKVHRTMARKVFLECSCCRHLAHDKRADWSTFTASSINNLSRAVDRFMMYHVHACEHIPRAIQRTIPRYVKSYDTSPSLGFRSTRNHWIVSAMKKGLIDDADGKGIIHRPSSIN